MVVIYLMCPSTLVQQPTAVAALRLGEGERVQEMGGGSVQDWLCQQTQLEEKGGGHLDQKKRKIDDAEVESNKEFVGSERWGRCLELWEAISQASDVF